MATVPRITPRAVFPVVDSPFASVAGEFANQAFQLAKFLQKKKDEAKELHTRELDTEYGLAQQTLLYGEDGTGGFNSLQGKAAIDAFPSFREELKVLRQTTIDQASGEFDSKLLHPSFDRRDESIMSQAYQKVSKANLEYDKQLSQARIQMAINSVGANPNALTDANEQIEAEILHQAAKMGLTDADPGVQLGMMQAREKLIQNAVRQALTNGDVKRAAVILERAGPGGDMAIPADTRGELAAILSGEVIASSADDLVEQATAIHGDDQAAAYEWIREQTKDSLKLQDEAVKQFMDDTRTENAIVSRARQDYRFGQEKIKEGERAQKKEYTQDMMKSIMSGEVSSWRELKAAFPEKIITLDAGQYAKLSKILDNRLTESTQEGNEQWTELMVNQQARKDIDADGLLVLGKEVPAPKMAQLIRTMQADNDEQRSAGRKRLDLKVQSTLTRYGLVGDSWSKARGILLSDFYDKTEERNVDITDKAAVDALFEEVFNANRLGGTIRNSRSSTAASTTASQRLNAIYKARDIDEETTKGTIDIMFREVLDKQYGGQPTAAELDNTERALLDNEVTVGGWFFGLNTTKKNIVEIFEGMSTEEISKARSQLIAKGAKDPSRAQIAFYWAQSTQESSNVP